ncbi:MAG: DUF1559 domain-containing protein [Gemmatales bacterium]|nr:DUF1559 domain-containing protein [Gemmatales bacterium]MCS7158917.1 DUF1559 domain-containing protein [Gemmatales bacterium]MDW8174116.1 DUF1559 domain-containing protein [Gemmatales bacterium]MDW8224150.1 DUF1559 domain-containing protein [Gemmatales bacterium]
MAANASAKRLRGVTVVELLVVIAIIGLLVSLLIPAVQRARESANRMRCASNLTKIAEAFTSFHSDHSYLPMGGEIQTSGVWVHTSPNLIGGMPNAGRSQRLGWAYQILPYIDQANLYRSLNPSFVIELYYCPSRRFPTTYGGRAQTDYAGNGGTNSSPASEPQATGLIKPIPVPPFRPISNLQAEIRDGLSNTMLCGEKAIHRQFLYQGNQPWDSGYFAGFHPSAVRWGTAPPSQDAVPAGFNAQAFGSAHIGTFHAVMADRAVRKIRYTVNASILGAICNRSDGQNIDWRVIE